MKNSRQHIASFAGSIILHIGVLLTVVFFISHDLIGNENKKILKENEVAVEVEILSLQPMLLPQKPLQLKAKKVPVKAVAKPKQVKPRVKQKTPVLPKKKPVHKKKRVPNPYVTKVPVTSAVAPVSDAPSNAVEKAVNNTKLVQAASSQKARGGAASPHKMNRYYQLLRQHIERYKFYPTIAKRKRQRGVVEVSFKLSQSGKLQGVHLLTSSGHRVLDEAAIAALYRAEPFPKPSNAGMSFRLPLRYQLKR